MFTIMIQHSSSDMYTLRLCYFDCLMGVFVGWLELGTDARLYC